MKFALALVVALGVGLVVMPWWMHLSAGAGLDGVVATLLMLTTSSGLHLVAKGLDAMRLMQADR
jgi:hypothetical protein